MTDDARWSASSRRSTRRTFVSRAESAVQVVQHQAVAQVDGGMVRDAVLRPDLHQDEIAGAISAAETGTKLASPQRGIVVAERTPSFHPVVGADRVRQDHAPFSARYQSRQSPSNRVRRDSTSGPRSGAS